MANAVQSSDPANMPSAQRFGVSVFALLSTLMVVLDQTIANVALPHMEAALGASRDSVSWVLTSYILASAVATPMTGWLSGRIGRKQLFVIAIVGFTISSAFCGFSVSLPMMIASRVAQGIFGAFLTPMSQAIMYDINPPETRVTAMTYWGLGVMVGPVLGPVLGGFLTDAFDWRWVFFINVPVGILAAAGMAAFSPIFPADKRRFDAIGFSLVLIAVAGFQLVLDRGTQQDWFESWEIILEAGLAMAAFWMLCFYLRWKKEPIFSIEPLKNSSFVAALSLVFLIGAIASAGSVLLSPMLQSLMGYTVTDAGLMSMPRGLGAMAAMLVTGKLMSYIDARLLIFTGMVIMAVSLWMMTGFTLQMGKSLIIWSGVLQGIGMGMSMVPINIMSLATLDPRFRTDATSIYSLARSLGGSVIIAAVNAILARNMQVNHEELAGSVHASTMPYLLDSILTGLGDRAASVVAMLDAEITRQSLMISYIDDYWLLMVATIVLLPVPLLVRKVAPPGKGEAAMAVGE
ncbi:MDR family MFS transporter [Sphingomonas montanisoli]|uniref:Multidrug efflux MFS transporter n=1 Tax=Sphingomonas montanisoli TaxID=2606412 RepID=A0A5D9BZY5_9SPHN|nr:MDR family MFS transporter [Sphingomonas montanisoli]TZG24743.1 multidrug efflux MFS transporter [Sphingomonas montanisoli]